MEEYFRNLHAKWNRDNAADDESWVEETKTYKSITALKSTASETAKSCVIQNGTNGCTIVKQEVQIIVKEEKNSIKENNVCEETFNFVDDKSIVTVSGDLEDVNFWEIQSEETRRRWRQGQTVKRKQPDGTIEDVMSSQLVSLLKQNEQNAVSFLNQYCQQSKIPNGPDYIQCVAFTGFLFYVKIGKRSFPPGNSYDTKKQAKLSAAIVAMEEILTDKKAKKQLFRIQYPEFESKMKDGYQKTNFFDYVADLVSDHADLLNQRFGVYCFESSKILAAFLLHDNEKNLYRVISMCTGNRSISGDSIKLDGTTLNDCHGEILSRRAFIRFLYLHLLSGCSEENSIFEHVLTTGKLALKPRYSVHLFVSTTPCGDGRIFTMGEVNDVRNTVFLPHHEPIFNDIRKQGLLRCKIENGHGSITIMDFPEQTLDGIAIGERLRTMSCSDKMLKWNILGVQGCLLNHFVEPIYLKTMTVGSLYHHGHVARAVCCRLDDLTDLPQEFRVNHPTMGQGGTKKGRDTGKTKWTALNWNIYESNILEIVDPGSGKTKINRKSRLSKNEMFKLFKRLSRDRFKKPIDSEETYVEVKEKNENYQECKRLFIRAIAEKNYGPWMNMPREEKLFQ